MQIPNQTNYRHPVEGGVWGIKLIKNHIISGVIDITKNRIFSVDK